MRRKIRIEVTWRQAQTIEDIMINLVQVSEDKTVQRTAEAVLRELEKNRMGTLITIPTRASKRGGDDR